MFQAAFVSRRHSASAPPGGSNTLLQGLVMYLKMDEASGDTASDSSGHGHNASAVSAAIATPGLFGNARDTTGSGKLTIPGDSSDFDSDAYSVALWVNMTPDGSERGLMCHEGSFASFGWRLAISISTPGVLYLVHNNVGECSSTGTVDLTGGWHRIFATYSGSIARLYVDGALVAEVSMAPRITAVGTGEVINIGCLSVMSSFQFGFFPGLVDEVGYWNEEVSASDVTADWNSGSGLQFSDFSM